MTAGLAVFLLACQSVDKPSTLNITERDPSRCANAYDVMEKHIEMVKRFNQETHQQRVTARVLGGEEAAVFAAAFNASAPASDYDIRAVIIFSRKGTPLLGMSLVDRYGCVFATGEVDRWAIEMWLRGEPIPEGFVPEGVSDRRLQQGVEEGWLESI